MKSSVAVIALSGFVAIATVRSVEASTCFRPRPSAEGGGYPFFEFGAALKMPQGGTDVVWQVGYVRNITPRIGVGGGGFVGVQAAGAGEGQWQVGLEGRMRLWANRDWSVDLSPGVTLWTDHRRDPPGFRGEAALSWRGIFGPSFAVESLDYEFEGGRRTSYAPGVKAESYPGLILGAVGGVVAGLVVLARGFD